MAEEAIKTVRHYSLVSKPLSVLLLTLTLAAVGLSAEAQVQNRLLATDVIQLNDAQSKAIKQKASQFIDALNTQEFPQARAALHPDLKPKWPPQKIEQLWQDLLTKTGPFKKQGTLRVIPTVAGNLVSVPVEFEQTKSEFLVVFNNDLEIVGVDFPKTESIAEIADKIVDALAAEDFASARGYLHPSLKQEIFPQQAQQQWQELLARTGAFQQRVRTEVRAGSDVDNIDVVLVTIQFEKVTEPLFVIFDHDKRIINIDFPAGS